MTDALLLNGLAEFYGRCWWRPELRDYLDAHRIDLARILPHVGAIGIMDVAECPRDRFDFTGAGERVACLVFEALDDDERPFDLVALPTGEPQRPMTLLGRVGFINPGIVFWRGSYIMGKAVPVHRNARDWLAAGCAGTAIVHPKVAALEMLDLPGSLAGQDRHHCRELLKIARSVVDERKIVLPETSMARAAA